jgi:hypothetical protein
VNEHPCLPPTKTKQLFGAPLEDVCDNDTLPTPILVGLILVSVTFLRRGVLRDQVFSSKSTPNEEVWLCPIRFITLLQRIRSDLGTAESEGKYKMKRYSHPFR